MPASREGTPEGMPSDIRPNLPVAWVFRLKAATRDVVERAGGYRRAGELCGYGKSTVFRWCTTDTVEIIPIQAALLLQAETGSSHILEAWAELEDRDLGPRGSGGGPGFRSAHIAVARDAAELAQTVAMAEDDGVITGHEQKEIDRKAADVARGVADLRGTVAAAGGEAFSVLSGGRGRR